MPSLSLRRCIEQPRCATGAKQAVTVVATINMTHNPCLGFKVCSAGLNSEMQFSCNPVSRLKVKIL